MASVLDVGLLAGLSTVFPFLLVLVLSYAVLSMVRPFKENLAFAAIASLALAFLTMLSPIAYKTIMLMSPWFVLFMVFGIFLLIAFQTFGVKEKTIIDVITGETPGAFGSTFTWWVIAIMLIIGIGSLSAVISEEKGFTQLPEGEAQPIEGEAAGFFAALTHPKVLGMAVVMLVAFFTIKTITERMEPT